MTAFFAGGHAVDLVLAVLAAEFLWLNLRPGAPRGRMLDRVLALAPGACLMLALRAALTSAPWPWVAAAVTASLPFHLADVARRRF